MQVIVADLGEDRPILLGPYPTPELATRAAKELSDRWGISYDVIPIFQTIGQYLRSTEQMEEE